MGFFRDMVDEIRWNMNCAAIERLSDEGVTMGDVHRFARVANAEDIEETFRREYGQKNITDNKQINLRTLIFEGYGNIEPEYREVFSKMITEVFNARQNPINAYAFLRESGFTEDEASIYESCALQFFRDPKLAQLIAIEEEEVTPQMQSATLSFRSGSIDLAMKALANPSWKRNSAKNNL